MSARREELTRQAARLFAQKGYHGTSIGEIAEALGVQKGSLYAHIESKQDLLYETMAEGARAFHAGLDSIPEELPATEKIRLALRSHLRVVADQLDVATVFVQEWRYLEGDRREGILAERRRYEERIRALFREGRELGGLRSDLDDATAALLALSAAKYPDRLQAGCCSPCVPFSQPASLWRRPLPHVPLETPLPPQRPKTIRTSLRSSTRRRSGRRARARVQELSTSLPRTGASTLWS